MEVKSQSPQTGQFNSYDINPLPALRRRFPVSIPSNGSIQFLHGAYSIFSGSDLSLNPLKRVNSILTRINEDTITAEIIGLNPLKRVNSILTNQTNTGGTKCLIKSQSPQTGQFNSYDRYRWRKGKAQQYVSIPSNGSIQFLLEEKIIFIS